VIIIFSFFSKNTILSFLQFHGKHFTWAVAVGKITKIGSLEGVRRDHFVTAFYMVRFPNCRDFRGEALVFGRIFKRHPFGR